MPQPTLKYEVCKVSSGGAPKQKAKLSVIPFTDKALLLVGLFFWNPFCKN
jgi:hypothetical protein